MFESINRDVLIVHPKKPFIDWVNEVFPDDPVPYTEEPDHDEATVYLLHEKANPDEALAYLKRNFKPIFENELFDWCTDKDAWPKNLTWEKFEKWFHFRIHSMVMDTGKGNIVKEDY